MSAATEQLKSRAEQAVADEDTKSLLNLCQQIESLGADLRSEVRTAQARRAAEVWHRALADLGYAVGPIRDDGEGTLVLEASRFPTRAVRVELRPASEEVRLNVDGTHDSVQCVRDVTAMQHALAEHGLAVTMTDWGRGTPGATVARDQREQLWSRA